VAFIKPIAAETFWPQSAPAKVNGKLQAYTPISILSVLSIIIETIVKTRLVDFVDRHAIFYARQYGFRHNSNTEAALFDFVAHTQQLVERKLKIGMMFYNLFKAFDTVNIEILLE
jgi:hypothetical protein